VWQQNGAEGPMSNVVDDPIARIGDASLRDAQLDGVERLRDALVTWRVLPRRAWLRFGTTVGRMTSILGAGRDV
jgi:hypothetical protein